MEIEVDWPRGDCDAVVIVQQNWKLVQSIFIAPASCFAAPLPHPSETYFELEITRNLVRAQYPFQLLNHLETLYGVYVEHMLSQLFYLKYLSVTI